MLRISRLSATFTLASTATLLSPFAHANCSFTVTSGNDTYTCSSGTGPGFTDYNGDNTLLLPSDGSGTITGDVIFGSGQDRLEMNSGTISGELSQGDGADSILINNGRIEKVVNQGNGIDHFEMNGGYIYALHQGDAHDTFRMTGGTIEREFEDGDKAWMSGGTIGRVDMKLDNNLFDMSGGQIIGNLVTGLGKDTIIVSAGRIGGNISTSSGDDSITISGGEVGGEIRAGQGNDIFVWDGGGTIKGAILLSDGDDSATLSNLSDQHLTPNLVLDAGLGNDLLSLNNAHSSAGATYLNWESISLNLNTVFDLSNTLTLGDTDSATGLLSIDASSALLANQGLITSALGSTAHVINSGLIDLTRGSSSTSNRLTIEGHSQGNGGVLKLQTYLGADSSASDRLVVSGGSISGNTAIAISNVNGPGELTLADGIKVIDAQNGTTSTNDAFTLASALRAGPYEYQLFKGGSSAGSANNWYLRSAIPTAPTPPYVPNPVPPSFGYEPAPDQQNLVIFYKPEVPSQLAVPLASALLTLRSIGTFHERQGEQSLVRKGDQAPSVWLRFIAEDSRIQWAGSAAPRYDGNLEGLQIGTDLYASYVGPDYYQRGGLFVGYSNLNGNISGYALGRYGQPSGDIELRGNTFALYWTLLSERNAYLDLVASHTKIDGKSKSKHGSKMDVDGSNWALSTELGYPISLSENWRLEPQVQVVVQKNRIKNSHDSTSYIEFKHEPNLTARLGARLSTELQTPLGALQPWMRVNIWHDAKADSELIYNRNSKLTSEHKSNYYNLDAGFALIPSAKLSIHAELSYGANLDSLKREQVRGNLGIRVNW